MDDILAEIRNLRIDLAETLGHYETSLTALEDQVAHISTAQDVMAEQLTEISSVLSQILANQEGLMVGKENLKLLVNGASNGRSNGS